MKLLLIRKSSLGDIIHAIPAFYALRASFPEAEIHWIVAPSGRHILERVKGVDRVRLWAGGLLSDVRRERFDLVLDLQGLLKTALLARFTGGRRFGFARGHTKEPFCQLFYTDSVIPSGTHVIDKNISLAVAAGATPPESTRHFGELVSPEDQDKVDRALDELGVLPGFVLLNPGAGWKNKRWNPRRFGELAKRLAASRPVLVASAPAERRLAETVVGASDGAARLAPETTFLQFGALAVRSGVVVAGDTGPMHLACAVGARVLGLFAPTSPFRNGPWNRGDRWIIASTRCDFCWKRRCPWENCIDRITVDQVQATIEEMLAP